MKKQGNLRVLPYDTRSKSSIRIANCLGALRILGVMPNQDRFVINWGNAGDSAFRIADHVDIFINKPEAVRIAVNKITFFQAMEKAGVPTPKWTLDQNVAQTWSDAGFMVCARMLIASRSGRGLQLCEAHTKVPKAKLYTRYTPKRHEFRIHVCGNEVIHSKQKKLKKGYKNPDLKIRTHNRGWVFVHNNIVVPECVTKAAVDAVKACVLDFGGVDIGWQEARNAACVYEVNTAPGVEGLTLDIYTKKIRELIQKYEKERKDSIRVKRA